MTSAVDPRTPCLIGVAQHTWRGDGPAPEPLSMWEAVCRSAAADARAAGGGDAVLSAAQSLQVVNCLSWPYDDPVQRLADRLAIDPAHRYYSGIGGTTTQVLVQSAAGRMLQGELEVAVISGGEALATKRRLSRADEKPQWSHRDPVRKPFPYEAPFHPAEVHHEVFQAWLTFALFDIARRGHLGIEPDAYRHDIGAVLAPMTEVAAANPNAWFPEVLSVDELITATPSNRMVGYPYTKRMISVMDVDMAAAVVVATEGAADALGVPRDRRVYLRGWGWATDPNYVAEHVRLWESPAMRAAAGAAFDGAGVGVDDIGHLDLYSCFGSSLFLALDALGLDASDSRGVTVTGGLPFAGGPANNYLGHALASMVEVLRGDAGSYGMVSGVGMHMTKHTYALYSTTPGSVVPPDDAAVQKEVEAVAPPAAITTTAQGPATVATYSVVHDRDGSRAWGLVVADLPDGTRCYARVTDAELLADMEASEWVGASVQLDTDGVVNRVVGADRVNFSYPPEIEEFRMEVRDWLAAHLDERFAGLHFRAEPDPEWLERMRDWNRLLADAGYAALAWPSEYGGRDAGLLEQVVLAEEMSRLDAPGTLNPIGIANIAPAILAFGTDEQKARFLRPMLRGDEIWCQGFSEPDAGSDLAALSMSAVRDGNHFVVNGQKVWNTFGNLASWCELLVRTDPTAPRHKGISCLLVDMSSPGIDVRPLVTITGEREFNELFFTDVVVPVDALLGAENEGWTVAMATLTSERSGVAALHLGVRKKIARLIELARHTGLGEGRAADHPAIRRQLAELYLRGEYLKLLSDRAVSGALHGRPSGPEASLVKIVWSEIEQQIAEVTGDVLGPEANTGQWGRDRVYARAFSIAGGTTQVNKNIIAQRVLGLPR